MFFASPNKQTVRTAMQTSVEKKYNELNKIEDEARENLLVFGL